MLYIVIIQVGQANPSREEVLTLHQVRDNVAENSVQVTLSHNVRENVTHRHIIQVGQSNPSTEEVLILHLP